MKTACLVAASLLLALGSCTRDATRGAPLPGGGGGPTVPEGSPLVTSPILVAPSPRAAPVANPLPPVQPVPVVIVSPAIGPIPSPSPIGTYAPIYPSPRPS